ncbi:MADF domain-containing protein [Aphelenchoides bicaudatus]|nr:MADF domain-containing protein [Aphelenchoides bicaudatus]
MDNSDGQPLASRNIDLFLNLISSNETDQLMGDSASEFPKDYDWSQPAKSWWRYFKKQTDQNTAMCYTCGAIFNRGPKQSTTSLSHHLKMYHREQFILIQQAKDEDLRHGNKSNHRSSAKRREVGDEQESNDDYVNRKKSAFNLSLINAVKEKPELYDNQKRQPDELNDIWEQIALEVGVTAQIAKKCWQSLCQRYRKEMKIAVRDNFAYKPKWPYFWDLNFLDEYFKSAENRRQSVSPPTELQPLSYLNGASNMASNINIFSNILSVACAKSPLVDEEEDASTDSAIASSEHSGGDQECQLEHNEKQDSAFITIQKASLYRKH